jgi:hypothetical protein
VVSCGAPGVILAVLQRASSCAKGAATALQKVVISIMLRLSVHV